MKQILNFLSDLEKNNNREWFDENRDRYQEAREKFLAFTNLLITEVREIDDEIPLLEPKNCMFRIFRDVRFSKDKRPYKVNFGSHIVSGGRKSGLAGYYLHIQPNASFAGGGVYMPPPNHLNAIRKGIFKSPQEYISITNNKAFRNTFPDTHFDKLKTAPRGYPKDWEHIDLLRNRSYAFGRSLSDSEVLSEKLLEEVAKSFKVLYPLNRLLNQIINENNSKG